MATHASILAGKFQGQRSLAGYSPWGHKESDMTEQLSMTSSYLQSPFCYINPEIRMWASLYSLPQRA